MVEGPPEQVAQSEFLGPVVCARPCTERVGDAPRADAVTDLKVFHHDEVLVEAAELFKGFFFKGDIAGGEEAALEVLGHTVEGGVAFIWAGKAPFKDFVSTCLGHGVVAFKEDGFGLGVVVDEDEPRPLGFARGLVAVGGGPFARAFHPDYPGMVLCE